LGQSFQKPAVANCPCNPSSTRKLETTFLPLPQICSIASRLGLGADFGFLNEVAGLADAAASRWSFLEYFEVGVSVDILFQLNLLKQALFNTNVKSEAAFEIKVWRNQRSPVQYWSYSLIVFNNTIYRETSIAFH